MQNLYKQDSSLLTVDTVLRELGLVPRKSDSPSLALPRSPIKLDNVPTDSMGMDDINADKKNYLDLSCDLASQPSLFEEPYSLFDPDQSFPLDSFQNQRSQFSLGGPESSIATSPTLPKRISPQVLEGQAQSKPGSPDVLMTTTSPHVGPHPDFFGHIKETQSLSPFFDDVKVGQGPGSVAVSPPPFMQLLATTTTKASTTDQKSYGVSPQVSSFLDHGDLHDMGEDGHLGHQKHYDHERHYQVSDEMSHQKQKKRCMATLYPSTAVQALHSQDVSPPSASSSPSSSKTQKGSQTASNPLTSLYSSPLTNTNKNTRKSSTKKSDKKKNSAKTSYKRPSVASVNKEVVEMQGALRDLQAQVPSYSQLLLLCNQLFEDLSTCKQSNQELSSAVLQMRAEIEKVKETMEKQKHAMVVQAVTGMSTTHALFTKVKDDFLAKLFKVLILTSPSAKDGSSSSDFSLEQKMALLMSAGTTGKGEHDKESPLQSIFAAPLTPFESSHSSSASVSLSSSSSSSSSSASSSIVPTMAPLSCIDCEDQLPPGSAIYINITDALCGVCYQDHVVSVVGPAFEVNCTKNFPVCEGYRVFKYQEAKDKKDCKHEPFAVNQVYGDKRNVLNIVKCIPKKMECAFCDLSLLDLDHNCPKFICNLCNEKAPLNKAREKHLKEA